MPGRLGAIRVNGKPALLLTHQIRWSKSPELPHLVFSSGRLGRPNRGWFMLAPSWTACLCWIRADEHVFVAAAHFDLEVVIAVAVGVENLCGVGPQLVLD